MVVLLDRGIAAQGNAVSDDRDLFSVESLYLVRV